MPITNVTDEQMKALGATSTKDFSAKLDLFLAQSAKHELSSDSPLLLDLQNQITALSGKFPTEARVTEIVSAAAGKSLSDFVASVDGKKMIAAEASRIAMESGAAIGTTPAKPAPAGAGEVESPEVKAAALARSGKFDEAFALLPAAQKSEFINAKYYGAFMRAQKSGAVKQINDKN